MVKSYECKRKNQNSKISLRLKKMAIWKMNKGTTGNKNYSY